MLLPCVSPYKGYVADRWLKQILGDWPLDMLKMMSTWLGYYGFEDVEMLYLPSDDEDDGLDDLVNEMLKNL